MMSQYIDRYLPRYHAPTHFGSDGPKPGSEKSTYNLVQNEPKMKPAAGPRIRTPIVIASKIENKIYQVLRCDQDNRVLDSVSMRCTGWNDMFLPI